MCNCKSSCKKCNCYSKGLTTNIVCPCDIPDCQYSNPCDETYSGQCVYHLPDTLTISSISGQFNIQPNIPYEQVLQKLLLYLSNTSCSYDGKNVKSVEYVYTTNISTQTFTVNFAPVDISTLASGITIDHYVVRVKDLSTNTIYSSPNITTTMSPSYIVSSPFAPIVSGGKYLVWVDIVTKDTLSNLYTCSSISLTVKTL